MIRKKYKNFVLMVVFFTGLNLCLLSPASSNTQAEAASNFIQSMADEVIGFISDPALSKEQKKTKLQKTLENNFDTYTVGRFTLGRYWQRLTPEQQKDYLSLYEEMIVLMYADRFSNYKGQAFKVSGVRPTDASDFIVQSLITSPEKKDNIPVGWHVRFKNGQFKIIDVTIENISMIITQKDDFASTIQRKGGNPAVILDYLRQRIEQGT